MSNEDKNLVIAGESPKLKSQCKARDDRVRRLAKKLGVKPQADDDPTSMVLFVLGDGTRYSWESFLDAHLALMEREA